MIRWFEHRQVFKPSSKFDAAATDLGRPVEDVWFQTKDGVRLNGWFYPADPNSPRRELVLMLLHGNMGNLSHRLPLYRTWLEMGLNVFSFDYRGYGLSSGRPSEAGLYLDAQAAHGWLRQRGFLPRNILVLGKSLGGGVASELALREEVGAILLQNTFTSVTDLGCEMFPILPVRRLSRIHFNTRGKLPRIKVPVLVMHSREDHFIRFQHGERNFQAASEPKMFGEIVGSHANSAAEFPAEYRAVAEKFLQTYFAPKALGRSA